jgi:hypothetical protein
VHKKDWVRKSQNSKDAHLQKVRKYNKLLRSANLRICGPPTFAFGIIFGLTVSLNIPLVNHDHPQVGSYALSPLFCTR